MPHSRLIHIQIVSFRWTYRTNVICKHERRFHAHQGYVIFQSGLVEIWMLYELIDAVVRRISGSATKVVHSDEQIVI